MLQAKKLWTAGIVLGLIAASLVLPSLVEARRNLYVQHLNSRVYQAPGIAEGLVGLDERRVREACWQMTSLLTLSPEAQGGGFDLQIALDQLVKNQVAARTYRELGLFGKLRALWAGPTGGDVQKAKRYAAEVTASTRDATRIADWAGYCATLKFTDSDSGSR